MYVISHETGKNGSRSQMFGGVPVIKDRKMSNSTHDQFSLINSNAGDGARHGFDSSQQSFLVFFDLFYLQAVHLFPQKFTSDFF